MSKIAVITGGSRGIGRSVTLNLAKAGYDVLINYSSNSSACQEVKKEVEAIGQRAECYQAAVENYQDVEAMGNYAMEKYGNINVLVNNAGITQDKLFLRMKEQDFEKVIDVNLKGVYNCSKVFSKPMIKNRSGTIINMASIAGIIGNAGQANYSASKAGVIGLTKTLARELAPRGVRVNAVAPGFIDTEMTENLSEQVKEELLNQIPMKRYGCPEEVAETVLFLTEQATYLTGQVINVDGGMVM
ncbi:3-oxoacyl-[acyl-carrier-protein] reductase [Natranaerobius thermophilus]|uniref:3-oxoacyl-[acyl-carrier-protein] reductase n=1 Tax=Natranaerobius thermophilus (strain ATCC BAA-1301 / DSM 18059 / JW/NM-WN-LF) TaxID=457570 RepID=B2A2M8_NATTJ|nr:3-oxoacyl-[acyl-carrier-protein] reductase [Natranaerobius thermophilus]ACB84943.1 3-oxoacyl-(acyl-carrier-protein) reductase [Natranaerobius thermophilus JW/NM-WN-LF]